VRTGHHFSNDFEVSIPVRNEWFAPGRLPHDGTKDNECNGQKQQYQKHAEKDGEEN
jgi:hypothetical protein